MTYHIHILKLLFSTDDHIFRIRKAERIKNLWKLSVILVLFTILIYTYMAYLGVGTDMISRGAVSGGQLNYESSKFWFIIGRIAYAILLAVLILYVPSALFHLLTGIPYKKLIIMQQAVLVVMLLERIIWIPLIIYAGLDWYVSPLSFGIIASYLTEKTWIIYFFGAISIFQLWIIWFQVKYLSKLASIKTSRLWASVIFLHVLIWCMVALIAFVDTYLIGGWFG